MTTKLDEIKRNQQLQRSSTIENFDNAVSNFKRIGKNLQNAEFGALIRQNEYRARLLPQQELNKVCQEILKRKIQDGDNFNGCTSQMYTQSPDMRKHFSSQPFKLFIKKSNNTDEMNATIEHEGLHNETTNGIGAMNFDFGQRLKRKTLCPQVSQRAEEIRKASLRKFLDLNDSLDAKPLFEAGILNQEQKRFKSRPILLDYLDKIELLEDECSDYLP